MKIFFVIIITSIAVVALMFLLNAASFNGITKDKNNDKSYKKI